MLYRKVLSLRPSLIDHSAQLQGHLHGCEQHSDCFKVGSCGNWLTAVDILVTIEHCNKIGESDGRQPGN